MGNVPINSQTSQTQVANTVNGVIRDLQSLQTVQVFKDEEGTRTAILDKDGLRTTAPGSGIDVYSASNDEFTFNSAFNTFKIIGSGTASVAFAADGTTETTTIAHGQNHNPIVFAYINDNGISQPLPHIGVKSTGADAGKVYQQIGWYADSTNIIFYNSSQLQGTSCPDIKYYILQETAN